MSSAHSAPLPKAGGTTVGVFVATRMYCGEYWETAYTDNDAYYCSNIASSDTKVR